MGEEAICGVAALYLLRDSSIKVLFFSLCIHRHLTTYFTVKNS